MIKFKNYVKVKSIEEAYELNQKKGTVILGGMLWLKMQRRTVGTVLDLSDLGLDQIEESEEEFRIGCMTTLRQIEIHPGLTAYCRGANKEAMRHIVGVQFRNRATVGGSIFGRYGFSDVLTLLMAMDTEVELAHAGRIPLTEFAKMPWDRDILVRVIVKKRPIRMAYISQRNTQTDFPVLACAVSCLDGEWHAAIGARPARAIRYSAEAGLVGADGDLTAWAEKLSVIVPTESNMRGSAQYRSHLVKVLVRRAGKMIGEQEVAE